MWNENDHIIDFHRESLQLAVNVGILGVILQVFWSLAYTILLMLYEEISPTISWAMVINNISGIGIIHSVFISVGFVAIFAMKGSKLGIIFPLMAFLSLFWSNLYLRISYALGIFSEDFFVISTTIIGYAIMIIGGLALLSIRDRSENREFLKLFAIIYIVRNFLSYVIWMIIFGEPVRINTAFDVLITSLPNHLVGIVFAILTISFFKIESSQDHNDQINAQELPFQL